MTTAGPATPAFRHEKGTFVKRRFWPAMGLLAAIMLAVYLANPFGTASLDPRARLLGVALYKIPSRSMEPTLQQGDFILANAARYAFADPQVGDLVVFRFRRSAASPM